MVKMRSTLEIDIKFEDKEYSNGTGKGGWGRFGTWVVTEYNGRPTGKRNPNHINLPTDITKVLVSRLLV